MVDELSIICKAIPEFTKEQIKEIVDKAQATEETKKTWESLDIIKKIEVIRHTLKPKPQFEAPEDVSTPQSKNSKGQAVNMDNQSNKGLIYAIVIGVVAIVVSVIFGSSQFVSKADFTKNIQGMNDVLTKAVNGVNDTKTTLNNKISEIPGMITTQTSGINTQMSQLTQQISSLSTDLNNKINSINSNVASYNQDVSNIKKEISSLQQSISGISGNVSNLSSSISALSANVSSKDDIKALQDKVRLLEIQLQQSYITLTPSTSTMVLYPMTDNYTGNLQILNSGANSTIMNLVLSLQSQNTTNITVNNAWIDGFVPLYSKTISSPNVTFTFSNLTIPPGTTQFNPQIKMDYSGVTQNGSNTWNVSWSKN